MRALSSLDRLKSDRTNKREGLSYEIPIQQLLAGIPCGGGLCKQEAAVSNPGGNDEGLQQEHCGKEAPVSTPEVKSIQQQQQECACVPLAMATVARVEGKDADCMQAGAATFM